MAGLGKSCLNFTVLVPADPNRIVMLDFYEKLCSFSSNNSFCIDFFVVDTIGVEGLQDCFCASGGVDVKVIRSPFRDKLPALIDAVQTVRRFPLLVLDIDMHENIEDMLAFIRCHEKGADVVFGHRVRRLGVPLWRRLMTGLFNRFVRLFTGVPLRDFNSPMILFSGLAAGTILHAPHSCGSHRLFVCHSHIETLKEIPIVCVEHDDKDSSYSLFQLILVGVSRTTEIARFFFYRISKGRFR